MLLRYSLADEMNARRIERGVESAFGEGARTAELAAVGAPFLGTEEFTNLVIGGL
jgi:hypothetical protein